MCTLLQFLSSFLLTAVVMIPAAQAQEAAAEAAIDCASSKQVDCNPSAYQMSAFDVATMAYRGYFQTQGIPSQSTLILQYIRGEISSRDIVQAAIALRCLSPETLENDRYLNALDSNIRGFQSHNTY